MSSLTNIPNSGWKRIIVNTIWLSGDTIINSLLGLLISIIITRYLGADKSGIISYVKSVGTLFSSVAVMGVSNLSVRYYAREQTRQGEVCGSLLVVRFIGACIAGALSIGYNYFISAENIVKTGIYFYILVYFCDSLEVFKYWFNSQSKSKLIVMSNTLIKVLNLVMCIILVIHHKDVAALLYWQIICLCLTSVSLAVTYCICNYKMDSIIRASKRMIYRILRDGWPLIIGTISTTLYCRVDQIMLKNMVDNRATGIYAVATSISEMWYFIPSALATSLLPTFSNAKDGIDEKKWQKILSSITALGYVMTIGICVFAKMIVIILYGAEYVEAVPLVRIQAIAGIFLCQAQIRGVHFIVANKTFSSLKVNVLGAVVNIILNMALIPLFGTVGAAIATTVSYFVYAFLSSYLFDELRWFWNIQKKAFWLKGMWK